MHRTALALLLALGIATVSMGVQAAPILYTSTSHTTSAFADLDGISDGPDSSATPGEPLPLSSLASVLGAGGSASAGASASEAALAAESSVGSAGGSALASAVATFLGEFVTPGGVLALVLDYESLPGPAGSDLFVQWVIDGIVQPVLGSGTYLTAYLPAGLAGSLELVLTSALGVDTDGDSASNRSSLAFALNAVPEPHGLTLVLGGLALLGVRRRLPLRAGSARGQGRVGAPGTLVA